MGNGDCTGHATLVTWHCAGKELGKKGWAWRVCRDKILVPVLGRALSCLSEVHFPYDRRTPIGNLVERRVEKEGSLECGRDAVETTRRLPLCEVGIYNLVIIIKDCPIFVDFCLCLW